MEIVSDLEANRRRIRSELVNIYRIIEGYNIQNWTLDGYMQVLGNCKVDVLNRVFMEVLRNTKERRLPSPGYILDEYNKLIKREQMLSIPRNIEPPPRNDTTFRSTVMSHMYLHYKNGWDVSDAQCVKEAYEKMCPGEKYEFTKFADKVPKEMVYKYMGESDKIAI